MKTSSLIAALCVLLAASAQADTVIGSWQTSNGDGWIDWSSGQTSITDPSLAGKYSFASGVVSGYGQSLKVTQAGYNQGLSIKLQNNGYVDDFMANDRLTFTFSVPGSAESASTAGYSQIYALTINAEGYGWNDQNWGNATPSGMPNFYFWDGSPARSMTVQYDYSAAKAAMPSNPGWVELIFTFNNGGGAPNYFYMNEVTLSVVPEPSSLALLGLGAAGMLVLRWQQRR